MGYFAPPPRIGTEIFTRLPDRFRRPRATAWARWNRGGREIDSFLEGPCCDAAGRLYAQYDGVGEAEQTYALTYYNGRGLAIRSDDALDVPVSRRAHDPGNRAVVIQVIAEIIVTYDVLGFTKGNRRRRRKCLE